MRERRAHYDAPGLIEDLIWRGTQLVREATKQTLDAVRRVMGLTRVGAGLQRTAARVGEPIK